MNEFRRVARLAQALLAFGITIASALVFQFGHLA